MPEAREFVDRLGDDQAIAGAEPLEARVVGMQPLYGFDVARREQRARNTLRRVANRPQIVAVRDAEAGLQGSVHPVLARRRLDEADRSLERLDRPEGTSSGAAPRSVTTACRGKQQHAGQCRPPTPSARVHGRQQSSPTDSVTVVLMDPATTALVSAGIAGAVAITTAVYAGRTQRALSRLQLEYAEKARHEAEHSRAKDVLDTYRGPLLSAAWELGDRIDNIRNRGLAGFGGDRRAAARITTAFRIAQYLGWREVVRVEAQLLRFESEADTSRAAKLMGDVVWVFATDKLDKGRLALWAEDQRGIGELMRLDQEDGRLRSRGYASFVTDYDRPTLARLEHYAELTLSMGGSSDRLRFLQWLLLGLVLQLDEEQVRSESGWTVRAWHEIDGTRPPEQGSTTVEAGVRRDLGELPFPSTGRLVSADTRS
jgi:hypothetical protein